MNRDNYIYSLQSEIVEMVENHLTPVALEYGYSEVPLETTIKWQPLVLIIGNYSSGKSTLINEVLGGEIQATGQAPTDDSFTVITCDSQDPSDETRMDKVRVIEERDGKFLLNDPEYPFAMFKKYGQRFSSHFCLKKVNSPFLKNLAIIDTPGMHDSISARDRGYDYQQVVGDFAQIADLILVLFDPHKAGTIREAHTSLRDTLPKSTFEDRILFVLNRIDECASLEDLLRVYGTLCWNLSQITGRKDIPTIHLTYSSSAATRQNRDMSYMKHLDNQRDALKKNILQVPSRRLDHMAAFVEIHSERLSHILEGLVAYARNRQKYLFRFSMIGFLMSFLCSSAAVLAMMMSNMLPEKDRYVMLGLAGGGVMLGVFIMWLIAWRFAASGFHQKTLENFDALTPLPNQTRKDSWTAIRDFAYKFVQRTGGRFSLSKVEREYDQVQQVFQQGCAEIREALSEISDIKEKSEE